jgi:DmsE family decaheme c-type cytochrome
MRIRYLLAALLLMVGGLAAPAAALAGQDAEASKACVECHDSDDLTDSSRHAHSHATDPRTPGCVTCHGPSLSHVKKQQGVKQGPPDVTFGKNSRNTVAERNGVCFNCHSRDQKRMLWPGSQHEQADVACTSCHKNHTNEDKVLSRATQTEVCYACHKQQRTEVARISHHPVPEGKMTCLDCHNVHGSVGPKLVKRDSTNDTCYSCHAEKRGPFVHPHEPATQDCASCHNPHGSTVSAMLKARPPLLCMQCHTPHVVGGVGAVGGQPGVFTAPVPGQSPAVTGLSSAKNVVNIWQARACTNCHTQTHGSNNPSATNPTPNMLFR